MDQDRRRRVQELYHSVLERSPESRAAFLDESCSGAGLRREVETLLAQSGDEVHHPVVELTAGGRLGPYEILGVLGQGGMGTVYKARDPRVDRTVAIKVCSAQFSGRFEREARAVAALNHPPICTLYDVGPNYLVMEYVDGRPLYGPLPVDEAMRLALQLLDALSAAHAKGITHRDLKPANILVTASGIKLLDFGLAQWAIEAPDCERAADETATIGMTLPGTILGSAAYMSPEQAEARATDARSDIFSFGAILYEILSGRRAFPGGTALAIMAAIVRDEPKPLDVPVEVARVVARCLLKPPAERFQTAAGVRAALEAATASKPDKTAPSIAVLPFANLSADKENEYFSDGLAAEILNLMSKIPGLKVIARTSSFTFRGKEQDITKIADALRVQHILEGSVRRSGNRVRVTAQLIQASDGTHLWSERYDRDMTDIFAIQDEIGQAISEALEVRLAPRARVVDVEAWEHWLKGVYYRQRNTPEDVAKAKEQFEQALAIDPNYAQAYSGLALCYYVFAALAAKPGQEMTPLVNSAAEKALAIDPSDSESHMALAVMAGMVDYDWNRAEKHHRRSVTVEHVSPRARFCYAIFYLIHKERGTEAIEQSRLALQSDPLSMIFHFGLVWCLFFNGQDREAMACARRAQEIDPNFHLLWFAMGCTELCAGLPDEAVASFSRLVEVAPWFHLGPGCLATAYSCAGDDARSKQLARQFARPGGLNFGDAIYYAAVGEPDAMFEALESAYQRRDMYLPIVKRLPFFDRYRADPRYQDLLMRMNLA